MAAAATIRFTWGALLCLIGLGAVVDAGRDLKPTVAPDGAFTESVTLRHIPIRGQIYRIEMASGRAKVIPESNR